MANKPNNPSLWSKAKSLAKQKFDVYPSAYANGWAAKWYKSKGGTWSKAAEYGMEVMEDGGMPDNEGFRALPAEVQQKIMSNMEYGGYMPEMPGGGIHYGTYAPPVFAAGGMPCYECGGMYEDGGGVPERYKNMGFDRVGQKKDSTSEGKKWMVLAKKGDDYKVVHGGYDGMKDFTQHGSEERRERFWDRMGGKDSAKAKDPFSPLYWHKRFGTWAEGGELDMYDDGGYLYSGPYSDMYQEDDYQVDRVTRHKLENLEDTKFNRALMGATSLTGPQSAATYLPKGSFLKGMMGLASGLSGAALGYKKMNADDKRDSKLMNTETGEYGNTQEILKARYDKANPAAPAPDPKDMNPSPKTKMTKTGGSGMGATLEGKNMYDDFSGASSGYMGDTTTTSSTQTNTQTGANQPSGTPLPNRSSMGSGMGNLIDVDQYTNPPAMDAEPQGAPVMPEVPAGLDRFINRGNVQTKRFGGLAKFEPGGPLTFQQWFAQNATKQEVMQNSANRAKLEEMWKAETGQNNTDNTTANTAGPLQTVAAPAATGSASDSFGWNMPNPSRDVSGKPVTGSGPGSGMYNAMLGRQELEGVLGDTAVGSGMGDATSNSSEPKTRMQKTWETESRGDDAGFVAGNNAIVGLGYFADWAERRDQRKNLNYDQQVRMMGNTDSMYNAYNPKNPFGNERTNMAVGPNSQLVMGTPLQDFSEVGAKWGGMKKYRQGGTYEVSPEEIMAILAAGGEIEYL